MLIAKQKQKSKWQHGEKFRLQFFILISVNLSNILFKWDAYILKKSFVPPTEYLQNKHSWYNNMFKYEQKMKRTVPVVESPGPNTVISPESQLNDTIVVSVCSVFNIILNFKAI